MEWSDGSRTLHLGEEVFNVMESAVSSKQGLNQYVFAETSRFDGREGED